MSRNVVSHRLRFRAYSGKRLEIPTREYVFEVDGREVILTGQDSERIRDSDWLIFNIKGFARSDEAWSFGARFKHALEFSSASMRVGINTGIGQSTLSLSPNVRSELLAQSGMLVRDNIHGLDVFEDAPNIGFITGGARGGNTYINPAAFLQLTADLFKEINSLSDSAQNILLLLNFALLQRDSVSQIVFAFSAVEMLGQNLSWSENQKRLIERLTTIAKESSDYEEGERKEVADAISRSLHRLSLRQGVFRLLDALNLTHLKIVWDRTYNERSRLIHGLAPKAGVDYSNLANKAVTLCGYILLRALAEEASVRHVVDEYAEKFFKMHQDLLD